MRPEHFERRERPQPGTVHVGDYVEFDMPDAEDLEGIVVSVNATTLTVDIKHCTVTIEDYQVKALLMDTSMDHDDDHMVVDEHHPTDEELYPFDYMTEDLEDHG